MPQPNQMLYRNLAMLKLLYGPSPSRVIVFIVIVIVNAILLCVVSAL